jgi:hypothetical protein
MQDEDSRYKSMPEKAKRGKVQSQRAENAGEHLKQYAHQT